MRGKRELAEMISALNRFYVMKYHFLARRNMMVLFVWSKKRSEPLPAPISETTIDSLICKCWHTGENHHQERGVRYQCDIPSCSCTQFDTRPGVRVAEHEDDVDATVYRTKSGHILTEAEIETLAVEAEAGYDLGTRVLDVSTETIKGWNATTPEALRLEHRPTNPSEPTSEPVSGDQRRDGSKWPGRPLCVCGHAQDLHFATSVEEERLLHNGSCLFGIVSVDGDRPVDWYCECPGFKEVGT